MIKPIEQLQTRERSIEIDLTGADGNAWFLLGQAEKLSRQLGKDADSIMDEMKSGDYEHLVDVFESEFGHLVTIYR